MVDTLLLKLKYRNKHLPLNLQKAWLCNNPFGACRDLMQNAAGTYRIKGASSRNRCIDIRIDRIKQTIVLWGSTGLSAKRKCGTKQ